VTSERRELPWLRALIVNPLLAVAGTVLAFLALAVVGASGGEVVRDVVEV